MDDVTRNGFRGLRIEIWSCSPDGSARKHGEANGLTFADACKQLSTECIDFWTHYERGAYQGRPLHASRAAALAATLDGG